MPLDARANLNTIFAGLNAVATVGAIVAGLIVIGQRDATLTATVTDLRELKQLVKDLAQVQQSMLTIDGVYSERIATIRDEMNELKIRIDKLDRK